MHCMQTYLSSEEFREKFGMGKDAFYKLPKWKQNKLKMALQLFWVSFIPSLFSNSLQFKLQVEESLLANLYILFPHESFT